MKDSQCLGSCKVGVVKKKEEEGKEEREKRVKYYGKVLPYRRDAKPQAQKFMPRQFPQKGPNLSLYSPRMICFL